MEFDIIVKFDMEFHSFLKINSPDIAQIENIFGWIKKHLEGRDVRTISKLKIEVRKTFKMIKKRF